MISSARVSLNLCWFVGIQWKQQDLKLTARGQEGKLNRDVNEYTFVCSKIIENVMGSRISWASKIVFWCGPWHKSHLIFRIKRPKKVSNRILNQMKTQLRLKNSIIKDFTEKLTSWIYLNNSNISVYPICVILPTDLPCFRINSYMRQI